MRLRNLFFIGLAATALFVGCDEGDDNTLSGSPSITATPETLEEFSATGGDTEVQTVEVLSNRDWIATPSADWISVEPSSGSASDEPQTVTVYVSQNDGFVRTGNITFDTGLVSASVSLTQDGADITYTSLADIREMGVGTTIPENTIVHVTMVSNYKLNNLTSLKNVYVQDETAGIQIRLTDDNETFGFGDELAIDLSGQSLSEYDGAMQVNNLPNSNITRLAEGTTVEPKAVTMTEFLENAYEGQYVSLSGVQAVEADIDKHFVENDSHTSIQFEDAEGNTFEVFSSYHATALAAVEVPDGSGVLKGVAGINNGDIQIILAQLSDIDGLTGERFESFQPEPGEIIDVTVAEFIAAEESEVQLYRLTGQMSRIAEGNAYGNFWLTDENGDEIYVYGLRESADAGNQTFENLGLQNGYYVTLVGKRGSYNNNPQVVDAYYESHEVGELPEEPEATAPFTSNITWTLGESAYDQTTSQSQTGTVNGTEVSQMVKLGTSKKGGSVTFHIPAGTTKIGFYCVAWSGNTAELTFSDANIESLSIRGNGGATGNPPYKNINVTGNDYYEINVTASSDLTVSADKRVIFWGINSVND